MMMICFRWGDTLRALTGAVAAREMGDVTIEKIGSVVAVVVVVVARAAGSVPSFVLLLAAAALSLGGPPAHRVCVFVVCSLEKNAALPPPSGPPSAVNEPQL